MKHKPVVDVVDDEDRFLPVAVVGHLAKVVGKSKTWTKQIRGDKGTPVGASGIAVDVSSQSLPKRGRHSAPFCRPLTEFRDKSGREICATGTTPQPEQGQSSAKK